MDATARDGGMAVPPEVMERPLSGRTGVALGVIAAGLLGGILLLVWRGRLSTRLHPGVWLHLSAVLNLLLFAAALLSLLGLTPVAPGEALVGQFFGRYVGTVRGTGLRWIGPFTRRRRISTKIRNHETAVAKVNDGDGNPIEIAAVVVWQVEDTARAVFAVDDFVDFVGMQSEAAVRHIATRYPYEARGSDHPSLRTYAEEVVETLSVEIAARVRPAGVRIIESRITRLAYAPEIAHAMLQRQQADAVVAARQRIVEGAVGMVEMALARLAEENVVALDEERKAAMVSNLLVVLCGDRATQPVVNTGSLYH